MRSGKVRVGGDGLAVVRLGGGSLGVLCGWGRHGWGWGFRAKSFEGQSEVVDDLWVVGELSAETVEDFERGGEVAGCQRVVGLLDEGGLRSGFAIGVREVLRGERGSEVQSGKKE